MRTPEQAVIDGFTGPVFRIILLFMVSYIVGIFHGVPGALLELLNLRPDYHSFWRSRSSEWVEPQVYPLIISPFFSSGLLALPLSVYCIVCSALDRGNVSHTTALGASTTFAMYYASGNSYGWMGEIFAFAFVTCVLMGLYAAAYRFIMRITNQQKKPSLA